LLLLLLLCHCCRPSQQSQNTERNSDLRSLIPTSGIALPFLRPPRIRHVRRLLKQEVARQMVSALILARFDYCNSLSSRPPQSVQPLQHVMNAASHVIMNLSICYHVRSALKELHWLLAEQRITYKLCLLMHLIHIRQAPQYLIHCVSTVSAAGSRYRLRSADTADYVLQRTRTKFGERGFCNSGPAAWNSLPSDLHLH